MRFKIHPDYNHYTDQLTDYILNYDTQGESYGNQERNSLKLFDLNGKIINVKSFKVPNLINKIVYKYFRKSKAQRSFEHANYLKSLNIGTPDPIAFFECTKVLTFNKSFYISQQLNCDYTYRDLTNDFSITNYEKILRAFTRFTFKLHENNILFLDHSPGNTLIKINGKSCNFYLVDLNRMEFKFLDLHSRIKNFERLTTHKSMVKIMSDEYAKVSGHDYNTIFDLMWSYTQRFREKFQRKKRIKKRLLFWRR